MADDLPDVVPDSEPEHDLVSTMSDQLNPLVGLNINLTDIETFTKDSELIIISKDGGKFGVCAERFKFVKTEKGKVILAKVSGKDEYTKELIAEFLVTIHEKEIKNSVIQMVKKALIRKPINTLRKLKKESQSGKKSKLHTRKGCVFLQIGDEAVNL